jgi:proteasome accessory factor C
VRATGERFDPASRADDDARDLVYRPRPEDPRVTLRLAPSAEWVIESHPHESASRGKDGAWQVVLAISEPAWLERLLVALGPDATVVAPPALVRLGTDAAVRLRSRYGDP